MKEVTPSFEKIPNTTQKAMITKTTDRTTLKSTMLTTPTTIPTLISTSTSKFIPNVTVFTTSKPTLKPVSIFISTMETTVASIATTNSTIKPTLAPLTKINSTQTPKMTSKNTLKTKPEPAQMTTIELTSTTTTERTSTLTTTLKPTSKSIYTVKIPTAKTTTQRIKLTKMTLPLKKTEKLTKPTKMAYLPKSTPFRMKPTKSTVTYMKLTTKSRLATKTATTPSIFTTIITLKSTKRAVPVTSSILQNKAPTTTDATSNAMLMPTDTGKVVSLSTIITICILLTITLIGWKYFKANKWNQFNSQQIEFKSNYPTEGTEESLIRSDSFIIDDSFDETLIDESDVDSTSCNQIKVASNAKKVVIGKKARTKRNTYRLGKECDQYSEKRCLTADDEQFDFTLQTTL